jgi:hypothetical protein
MPNTFEILSAFLTRFDQEVEGRDAHHLPPEIAARLRSFAQGQLPVSEQAKLIGDLNKQPDWVATLAAEVKALRNSGGDNRKE